MELEEISVDRIKVDRNQPRTDFDRERLRELADSIQEVGQLQPIIVTTEDDSFRLIVGERRFRAVKEEKQGDKILALILEGDVNARQIQLIENLQRQDLNPLERARSIQQFIDSKDLSKKSAARRLGVPRTTLTEWLNILEVDSFYQQAVLDEDSSLTLSHITLARSLANRTGDPSKLEGLLDGVLKYNLTREETRSVVDLFHKYLHLSMEEAFSAVLLKREHNNITQFRKNDKQDKKGQSVSRLLNSFSRMSDNLEEFMEDVGQINSKEEKKNVMGEFLYIYQLLETMLPELKNKSIKELISELKMNQIDIGGV
ncbi:MAG: ParB/RepB/Spo0J family partition protein [Halanaerobiaceae bacterium]